MAEQMITNALKDVVQEIRVQSLTKHVRVFHGEGTTKFANWLKDMDQLSSSCDSERMCVLATLTLGGPAGSFAARTIKDAPQTTWLQLRKSLKDRYSDLTDPALAQERCRQLHQRKGESVQNFAERLRSAAMDAYDDVNVPHVQKSLVETFQRGVSDDRLARNLIRKKYSQLDEAIKFATEEQRADRTFEMYRHVHAPEEPMEVEVVQESEETGKLEKIQDNIQKLSKQLERVSRQMRPQNQGFNQNQRHTQSAPPPRTGTRTPVPSTAARPQPARAAPPPPPQPQPPVAQWNPLSRPPGPGALRYTQPPPPPPPVRGPQTQYQWTRDGRPICAACGGIGHIHRRCRAEN